MEKFKQLNKIKEVYSRGENIIKYLKQLGENNNNTIEDILISYDFQAGSYIKGYAKDPNYKSDYCEAIAKVIDNLGGANSIIEVGIGEATTLGILLGKLNVLPKQILGFDISWSRVKFAKKFLEALGFQNVKLFTGNLFEIPLRDNSVDIVYTSHSIEPNGGQEEEALRELYRITNEYLILLEPAFDLASPEAKKRMLDHGYVTKLHETAKKLNYNIIEYRLFEHSSNPLNPTGLLIIKKEDSSEQNSSDLVCPLTHSKLETKDSFLFAEDAFLTYPILDGIPCLLKENSILASHLKTDFETFKKENNINLSK